MIALVGASAIVLTALQASINAPRDAFRVCLKDAVTKANAEKVGPEGIEAYLRTNCSVQLSGLKAAVTAFNMKNGMAKKAAASDADLTVSDYVASPVEKYKFMAEVNAPKAKSETPAASTPAPAKP